MKAKPQKLGNTGKTGQVAGKSGKKTAGTQTHQKLDKDLVGSAIGILNKHFK